MPATWPAELPQYLLLDGNQEGLPDGRIASQTDTGPPKMRRRSSAMSSPLSGLMIMTRAQRAVLKAFIADDLAGGTLPFTFPGQVLGDADLLTRFTAGALPAFVSLDGENFRVSIALEVLP